MNEEEIDEILDAIQRNDVKWFIQKFKLQRLNLDIRSKKTKDMILDIAMEKIEQGGYEYLCSKINDMKYKEEYLILMSHSTKINDMKYLIEHFEEFSIGIVYVKDLIIGIKDPEYTKTMLKYDIDNEIYNFEEEDIVELIISTNDISYAKSIIESGLKRRQYGLYRDSILEIIIRMNDREYIQEILHDELKIKQFHFGRMEIVKLINKLSDIELVKKIINDKEKIEMYNFYSEDIVELIASTHDTEYIKEILSKKDMIRNYKFNKNEIGKLVLATNDKKIIEKYFEEKEKLYGKKITKEKIEIPADMTIGIEIESEGVASKEIIQSKDAIYEGWESKGDGSIPKGVEIVSPILTGNTYETTEQIKKVCERLAILRTIYY